MQDSTGFVRTYLASALEAIRHWIAVERRRAALSSLDTDTFDNEHITMVPHSASSPTPLDFEEESY